ncbi:MAG: THxN family PEP-CTERM protein [Paraglaciecola sp.]|uniref:THxN family PEP-CTERM protein n=1 Tax=Paraglaciecola sp. TaxID=1920173 RepID=UPI00326720BD
MKKLNTVFAAMTLAVVGTANAAQITSWNYINEAGFTDFTQTLGGSVTASGDATPNGLLGVPASTDLTWGEGLTSGDVVINGGVDGIQSSFQSASPVLGTVDTNGGLEQGTDLFHNNWVVGTGDGLLIGASFLDALQLTATELDGIPYVGPALVIDAPTLGFEISFLETVNGVDYDLSGGFTVDEAVLDDTLICPDGTLNGTGVNLNGCADIFAITSGSTDFDIVGGNVEFSGSFILDEYEYTITTVLSGLQLITDTACVTIGLDEGCIGFLTTEEMSNQLVAEFRIDSELVPVEVSAPASIALLGLGLIGLGGLARRKK